MEHFDGIETRGSAIEGLGVFATRAFIPGERILRFGQETLPCHCGTARCRGTIPGSVFSLGEEWLREYEPLMAEWFIRENRTEYRAMCERLGIAPRA